MREYNIIVKNGGGVVIYNDIIKATNENEALITFLKSAIINDEDTITINEK